MLRIKVPSGILTPAQYRTIGELAQRFGRDYTELSTRQNVQLHWIQIKQLPEVFAALEVDRTTDPSGRFVHATLRIGDSVLEMGQHEDVNVLDLEQLPPVGMHLYVEDVHAVVARAEAAGVRVVRPVQRQPYGDLEASLADPFGIVWFVATHVGDA